jgi:hypothetical protein
MPAVTIDQPVALAVARQIQGNCDQTITISKGNVTGPEDRKTLSIVPLSSVLFAEKTVSEQFIPGSHP